MCCFYFRNTSESEEFPEAAPYKLIYATSLPAFFNVKQGSRSFKDFKCAVDTCTITTDKAKFKSADLVWVYEYNRYKPKNYTRPSNQVYAYYSVEPPMIWEYLPGMQTYVIEYYLKNLLFYRIFVGIFTGVFNWTITYRRDSTIPVPTKTWIYYDQSDKQKNQHRNFAKNKTKKVAWFATNCYGTHNNRIGYIRELQKYIEVTHLILKY